MRWALSAFVVLVLVGTAAAGGLEMRKADALAYVERWHEDMPLWLESELKGHARAWRSLTPEGLRKVAFALMASSPERTAECLLRNRPEFGGGPWRFYSWQKESLEYPYSVVNKSAKGTGKTREIVALIFHALLFSQGSILHAANSMTTRDEVWEELLFQIESSRLLKRTFPKERIRRGHPRRIQGPRGNSARFLLARGRGEQLRSVHIGKGGWLLGDEVAVWPDACFPEFFGRAEAGCFIRLYSVPDGRLDSEFFRLAERAVPLGLMRLRNDGEQTAAAEEVGASEVARRTKWAFVHWERPMMPPPHWDAEAKLREIEKYRGEETPGYQQYVLGRDGDPVGVVFPWGRLKHALRRIPDYRLVRVVYDLNEEQVRTSVDVGVVGGGVEMRRVQEQRYPIGDFELNRFVDDHLPALPCDVVGVDAGRNEDPSELLLFEVTVAPGLRLRARVQLLFCATDVQGSLVAAIGRGKVGKKPRFGIGIEASGASHGQAIWDYAIGTKGKLPRALVTAWDWRNQEDVIDPRTNRPERDANRHKVRRSLKESATTMLEELLELQTRERGHLELHDDPDVRREWSSHAAREGTSGRVFDKKNDHTIEAARAAVLRWREARSQRSGAAVAGSASPRRSTRESWDPHGAVRSFNRRRR